MARSWGSPGLRFVAVRLAATAVLLVALSFVVFGLLYLAPGDPARNLLGAKPASPEALAAIREAYHLNDGFVAQYLHWLSGAVRLDFGDSIRSGGTVMSLMGERSAVTLQLSLIAFVLTILVGIPAGLAAGWRAGRASDRVLSGFAMVGVGAPSFAVGLVLLYLFGVRFDIFPVFGVGDGGFDRFWHLLLPAITLAFGTGALVFKLTRTAVVHELGQDYVTFARSRGLSGLAIARLVLRNAAIPIVTSLGLVFAFFFGGTLLVEVTFALPGLGSLLASSVTFKDVPVVQAITLLTAAVIALTALAVDVVTWAMDPRVRAGGNR